MIKPMGISTAIAAAVTISTLAISTAAGAIVIDIDSTRNGSYLAGGPLNVLPGTNEQPFNAISLTFAPGVYEITNAATSGYYSAWNYEGYGITTPYHWVWSFMMAEHGGKIIEDVYINAVYSSQAAAAAANPIATYNGNTLLASDSTAGFREFFTLNRTTTLDFYVDDWNWGLSDNYGGVALNIQSVPEPATASALLGGLLLLGARMAGRRKTRD